MEFLSPMINSNTYHWKTGGDERGANFTDLPAQPIFFFSFLFFFCLVFWCLAQVFLILSRGLGVEVGTCSNRRNRKERKRVPRSFGCLARGGATKDVGVTKKVFVGNRQREFASNEEFKFESV